MAIEYAASGIADYVAEVLWPLPSDLRQPIQYTFANHVTKERPLTLVRIAEELGVAPERSLGVAACTDILWNVGIVVDDIYDKDETNACQRPSAWARFGKATAFVASTAAVAASVAYTARRHGIKDAYSMSYQLRRGVASLTQSRSALSLDSPLEEYYRNYDMRSGFYTVSPVATIGKYSEASPRQVAGAQHSLLRMNRAGQMINDLQDFDQSGGRSRVEVFSDMRNGVSSIPIRHMWQTSDAKNRQRLLAVHGKADLSDSDMKFISDLIGETDLPCAMLSLIGTEYATARGEYIEALEPSGKTLDWLDKWQAYKREQARNIAAALDHTGPGASATVRL